MESILVCGAEGFLGRHTALHFLKKGFRVFGTIWKDVQKPELISWMLDNGAKTENLTLFPMNLLMEGEVAQTVKSVLQASPGTSRVVNCAGGFEWVKVVDASRNQVDFLFQANFFGNWILLKCWLPVLMQQNQGRIVVISAAASQAPAAAGMGPYVASKAALNSLVEAANAECAGKDVRVERVFPTIIDTPRNRADMPQADFKSWMTVEQVILEIEKKLH